MSASITSQQVWDAIEKEMFAVVGMVTPRGEARTAGIIYTVRNRKLIFSTETNAWKTQHIQKNPNVSMTVTVAKRVPFMPWIKVPPATITFSGTARIMSRDEVPANVVETLMGDLKFDSDPLDHTLCIEVTPSGHFVTYGIGVSASTMLKPAEAGGRAEV